MVYPQKIKNQFNVDQSILQNVVTEVDFAISVNGQANTKVTGVEVPVGAHIQAMDVYVNAVSAEANQVGSFVYYMAKVREGQGASFPVANFTAIGLSKVRNQIFKSEMLMIGTEDAGPIRHKFRQRIPKVYQRMRDGDKIAIFFQSSLGLETSVGTRYYYKE